VAGEDGRVSEQVLAALVGGAARPEKAAGSSLPDKTLDKLIHDISSKAGSLTGAASLLRAAPPEKARTLLAMMTAQTGKLAAAIAALERVRAA